MPLILIALLLTTTASSALAQKKTRRKAPAPQAPLPASVSDKLLEARKLAEELEYPGVIQLTEAVIADEKAQANDKLEAYILLGSAQAFMGNPLEAESAFRFLLRGRPDYEFPEGTSPKITWVFRKVQHEEREILKQTEEMRRARVTEAIELGLDAPSKATGGEPVQFRLRVKDPFGAVEVASLHYRKLDEPRFARMPLKLDNTGTWVASIPAELTANQDGETIEYFIGTEDQSQAILRTVGSETDPLRLALSAGQPPTNERLVDQWWFWTASVGAVAALSLATFLVVDARTSLPDGDADPISVD
ncbi:MAG: hypothetical protein AAF654_08680 [Myxococcota bacterium]